MPHRHHSSTEALRLPAETLSKYAVAIIAGAALGAGFMFMLDPTGGRRRRAMMRDKARRYVRQADRSLRQRVAHGQNRVKGAMAEARHRIMSEHIDDRQLHERVRAMLGRVVSRPHNIRVDVCDGCVVVSGPVLEHEVDELCDAVAHVRGVRDVVNQLEVHRSGEGVPGLQGLSS